MAVAASEIGGLVGSLAGIGRNIAAKDWIATGIGAGAFGMETTKIIVKGIAERRIKAEIERGLQERTNPWAAEVPIIEWGIVAITVFEYCLGLGDATKGVEFDNARSKLDSPKRDLQLAIPDNRWESIASQEYAKQNQAQLNRVSLIQAKDQAMMDALAAEVAQLTEIRRAVAGIKDGLTGCIFVALLIKAYGSEASSLVFQKVVTLAAIAATVSAIGYMEFYSGTETKPKLKEVVEEYEKMIAEMNSYLSASHLAPTAGSAPAKGSKVADFSIQTGATVMQNPSTSAGEAAPNTSTTVSAPRQQSQTSEQPVSGTPGLSPLLREPTPAEDRPGQSTSPLPSTGTPPPATAARRSKTAPAADEQAAPASVPPEEATVSPDIEVAGAAAGAEATERPPVELTSPGAEQAPGPSTAYETSRRIR
ncbi:EspA/EspE family type VII secretion system effector [Mycobacterium sp. pR1184]|uniref:EspA/EspE family type VII secretion system effector n=1 Tax=Mycobacterium sp. pR1184 TaxID=3238981 RepID=UPI00351B3210